MGNTPLALAEQQAANAFGVDNAAMLNGSLIGRDMPILHGRYAPLTENVQIYGYDRFRQTIAADAPKGIVRGDWDVDGIIRRRVVEALLYNADRYLERQFNEATFSVTGLDIAKVRQAWFPMITRVMASTIAHRLCAVQPIPGPTGQVFNLSWFYQTAPSANNRVDLPSTFNKTYSLNNTEGSAATIRRVKFRIQSQNAQAEVWKLLAAWSIEAQEDLQNVHGLSTSDLVPRLLTDLLQLEIDRLCVDFIYNNVGYTTTWDASDGGSYAAKADRDKEAYDQRLYSVAIQNAAANIMYRKNVRPNFIVCHSLALPRLQRIKEWDGMLDLNDSIRPGASLGEIGPHVVGRLGNEYTVICDPHFPDQNALLLGYRGPGPLDWMRVGIVLAMYVPPLPSPVFMDPNEWEPRQGARARACFVKADEGEYFYALINMTNTTS